MDGHGPGANDWVNLQKKRRQVHEHTTVARTGWISKSVENDEYAPIAACSTTVPTDRPASATLSATLWAGEAPRLLQKVLP